MANDRRRVSVPEEVVAHIWREHLDGYPISEIVRFSGRAYLDAGLDYRECTRSEVLSVLSEEPPEPIRSDLRYRYLSRAFWMSADGVMEDGTVAKGLIVVFQPLRMTTKTFQSGIRAISRDFRSEPGCRMIDPYIVEGLEMERAIELVEMLNYPAWVISASGSVSRFAGEFAQPDEPADDLLSPGP